jgi:hypothetical protein
LSCLEMVVMVHPSPTSVVTASTSCGSNLATGPAPCQLNWQTSGELAGKNH